MMLKKIKVILLLLFVSFNSHLHNATKLQSALPHFLSFKKAGIKIKRNAKGAILESVIPTPYKLD